jgi:para-aminobenzoate synthetase component 1
MRRTISISSADLSTGKILQWGRRFDPFVFLNSNNSEQLQKDIYGKYDWLVAAGALEFLDDSGDFFSALKDLHNKSKDWAFGYLTYDVKNQLENLQSQNEDNIHSPLFCFFQPRYVLTCKNGITEIHFDRDYDDENSISQILADINSSSPEIAELYPGEIKTRVDRDKYISTFQKIIGNIHLGDIYEMNYCIEFFSENTTIDPVTIYYRLNGASPMPFSAFFQTGDISIMCASPERYLAKRNKKIISQPIKGTAKRGTDTTTDEQIKLRLSQDPKEQAENVMIVDMVRNDLSRTAAKSTVKVEELFGVKTFKQLHQMISTVVSEMKEGIHFTDVIAKSFPMGSMTGAPKVSAMNLIEEYEDTKRGIFSGSIGYVEPGGDFDFNVVIRSIIYNRRNRYLSYMAGSAITINANAEQEYEECLLKASAMRQVLSNKHEHA